MTSDVEIGDRRDQRKQKDFCCPLPQMDRSTDPVIDALPSDPEVRYGTITWQLSGVLLTQLNRTLQANF